MMGVALNYTKYCTFFVEGLYFGVDVRHVQEVLRSQPMTHVPRAHRVVRGLINLRGQILTAVDLRERLGLGGDEPDETMNVVVTNHQDESFSLVVDNIGDVLDLRIDHMEQVPTTLGTPLRSLLEGVQKLEDSLLLILDLQRTMTLPEPEARQESMTLH